MALVIQLVKQMNITVYIGLISPFPEKDIGVIVIIENKIL